MKQKAIFILRARRMNSSQAKTFTDAIDVVDEAIGKFLRSAYSGSSVVVHVQMSRDEAVRVRNYVSLVLTELLEIRE